MNLELKFRSSDDRLIVSMSLYSTVTSLSLYLSQFGFPQKLTPRKGFGWKFGDVERTSEGEQRCDIGKGKHPVREDIKLATTTCT